MSYSRWSNSYWYTYWHACDSNYMDEQLLSVDCDKVFTYKELKEDIQICVKRVRQRIEDDKENRTKLPTEEEYKELEEYMKEFIQDVESSTDLIKKEFPDDPEAQCVIEKHW